MIEALMALRCLEQVEPEPFRPVLQLTEFGREVMKGKASFDGALPVPLELLRKLPAGQKEKKAEGGRRKAENQPPRKDNQPSPSPPSPLPLPPSSVPLPPSENRSDEAEILKALRRWREEIAAEAGVPMHYILNNDTLAELRDADPALRKNC